MTGFNEGTLLIDGNTAAALGAVFGGFTFASWYPITPSSSLAESLSSYAAKLRRDPETKARRPTPSCRPKTNWRPSAW